MKSSRGFTLLEVMIAVSIMSVGIVGALELFSGSLKLAGDAAAQGQATVLAQALVDEELWRDVMEENQRSGSEGRFSYTVGTRPIDRELVGLQEEERGTHDLNQEFGLWLIEAEVRWEVPTGEKSVFLETARLGQLNP